MKVKMKKQLTTLFLVLCTVLASNVNAQVQPSLLHVEGPYLMDDCGDTIILK